MERKSKKKKVVRKSGAANKKIAKKGDAKKENIILRNGRYPFKMKKSKKRIFVSENGACKQTFVCFIDFEEMLNREQYK